MSKLKILHIGVHNSANKNSGDTLLFPAVRQLFDYCIADIEWTLMQAWDIFDLKVSDKVNQEFDAIVIGGGGMLLKDQEGSDTRNSGWQWNSTIQAVENIKIPLIVFAIGYNRFRGQEDFDPIFYEHIHTVVRKSSFFGLRNYGSMKSILAYLPLDLHGKVVRQYCPTTVTISTYGQELLRVDSIENDKVLAFNAAFDREAMRFGGEKDEIIDNVVNSVRHAADRGWNVKVVAHKHKDLEISDSLLRHGVEFSTVNLTDGSPTDILNFYNSVDLAYGMRGHAQMIPFGLKRPIFSCITHDKMRYFLDDIGKPDWGGEALSNDLLTNLDHVLDLLEFHSESYMQDLDKCYSQVWQETSKNMKDIKSLFTFD